jgi:FkbM family methyltransferase
LDTYELPERTLINGHLSPNACVLEMGASLGIVSCLINRSLWDRSRHVAIEVNAELLPVMEINRVRNGCEFSIENCAITRQKSMFFQRTDNSDGGRISSGHGVPIATRDLSEVEISRGLAFDTIVMDIEGAEIAFLAEYEVILPRIATIIVEFHPKIVSQNDIETARGRLIRAGLRSVGRMLDVEAFSRVLV